MTDLSPVDAVVLALLEKQEGEETYPYDDATAKRVHAPKGNLSWGFGFNLEQCGSHELFVLMLTFLVRKIETAISAYAWYEGKPAGVQTALLDIAYNAGIGGLLHYPEMLGSIKAGNYHLAALQCTTSNPRLQARYEQLAALIDPSHQSSS